MTDHEKPSAEKQAELLYMSYIKEAGLYGKTFYSHVATRGEKKKIRSLWRKSQREVGLIPTGVSPDSESSDEVDIGGEDETAQY